MAQPGSTLHALGLCLLLAGCGDKDDTGSKITPDSGDSTPETHDTRDSEPPDSPVETGGETGDTAPPPPDPNWFPDNDGDGFGVTIDGLYSEVGLSGYVREPGDCDDTDFDVNPLARERCNGVDDDCDGDVDEVFCDGSLAGADAILRGVEASGQAGTTVCWIGDMDGDGVGDLAVGATHVDDTGSYRGAAYVVSGPFSGEGSLADATARLLGGADEDYLGSALAAPGDLDGDGLAELLVGAEREDSGGGSAGAVYLLSGPLSGELSLADATGMLLGQNGDDLGSALSTGFDSDGDGVGELMLAAEGEDRAYLVPLDDLAGTTSVADVALAFFEGDRLSAAVGVPDLDGDGLDDLVLGNERDGTTANNAGAVFVFAGGAAGALELSDADALWLGVAENDYAGSALAGVGDMDGDGLGDLAVTALHGGSDYQGAVHLLSGSVLAGGSLADSGGTLEGEAYGDLAGYALAAPGDLDGDGHAELVVSAREATVMWGHCGAVYLVHGPVVGTVALADAHARWGAEAPDDAAGTALSVADGDGDGVPDLLVGAPYAKVDGLSHGGAFVIFGLD